jgi:curved DNA-binding protein CbpA
MHPDAGGDPEEFARLREAHAILRSPAKRLRHWLETGGVAWEAGGSVPDMLMGMFGAIGELLQRVDGLTENKAAARSALGRSLLERKGMELLAEVEGRMDAVRGVREELAGRFEEFASAGAQVCAGEAAEVARALVFLEKWEGQLRERWAGLAV